MTVRYTQHEKLAKVSKESQAVGSFLEWLRDDQGIALCKFDEEREEYYNTHINIQDLLAKYYGINLGKLEEEKRHMLQYMRGAEEVKS